jgi:hypothetical protein
MAIQGTVLNGVVVPDNGQSLPEGARVEIVLADEAKPTLIGLLKFAGALSDLPADFAAEHDHYIHGTPKRNEKAD